MGLSAGEGQARLAQPALGSLGDTKTQPAHVSSLLGEVLAPFPALPSNSVAGGEATEASQEGWSILPTSDGHEQRVQLGTRERTEGVERRRATAVMGTPALQARGRGQTPPRGRAFRGGATRLVAELLTAFQMLGRFLFVAFFIARCGTVTLSVFIRG